MVFYLIITYRFILHINKTSEGGWIDIFRSLCSIAECYIDTSSMYIPLSEYAWFSIIASLCSVYSHQSLKFNTEKQFFQIWNIYLICTESNDISLPADEIYEYVFH